MTGDSTERDGATPVPGNGPITTFETVVELLERWQSEEVDNESAPGRLQQVLERELNDETDGVLDRDVVERRRRASPADVTVNGEIGITLIGEVRQSTIDEVTVELSLLADWYNFIIVYWLDPSPESIDYRRTIERRTSGARLGIRRLSFVTGEGAEGEEAASGSGGPFRPSTLAGGVLVGLVLSGVGIGMGYLGWTLTNLGGPSRLLLIGVAGLFIGVLAFGTMIAVQ
jgi:hypothetical protein